MKIQKIEIPDGPFVSSVMQADPYLFIHFGTPAGIVRITADVKSEHETYTLGVGASQQHYSRQGAQALILALSTVIKAYDQEKEKA